MTHLRCWLLIGFMCLSALLCGADQGNLQVQDIHRIMKQIFDQHVDKKEITASILRNSFKVYIDQFDPDRIYLLEKEVHPYLQMSDREVEDIMERYKKDQYTEYEDLNNVIQKAIIRAQQDRALLLKGNMYAIFQKSGSVQADGYEEWRDPDLQRNFVAAPLELDTRWKDAFIQFVAAQRKRYGDTYISDRMDQTYQIFDKEARDHENQYLFLNNNGQPMSAADKQNVLTVHILKALANSLDAHTTVMSPLEAANMRMRLENEQPGIGIQFHQDNHGSFIIEQLIAGGPAAKSGLVEVNDEIVKVDDQPIKNKSVDDVLEMLGGADGSKVILTLKKQAGNDVVVPLVREDIEVVGDRAQSSYVDVNNGIIGMVKLDSFYQNEKDVSSENDVRDAIVDLKKKGNLRGLILDLRENSGGFLAQAIKIVGLFITNGVVVISKYFNGEEHFYRDMDNKRLYDGPLIVLTSKATASAAEIVAQALQDYGVAIIVGDEQTYGKGTIQSQTVTENNSSAYFKVTVGKYYTVSGKTPQIQGVKADIVVPSQFAHEKLGERYLDNSLVQDTIPETYDDPLKDIDPDMKSWYMTYYMPALQHKQWVLDEEVPALNKASAKRIADNREYQAFLKGNAPEILGNGGQDFQMEEAVNIMKDIIHNEQSQRKSA